MNLPTLYKKTSTGAIQFWTIEANLSRASETGDDEVDQVATIVTTYGQVGTDSPQVTYDRVREGKNAGKKNATTAFEQALKEATAKHEKQRKKGYVDSIEAAQNDQLDEIIEGGVVPMLAGKFEDHAQKIKYPASAQPKLDGIRCIAVVKDGECTLWSRTRKPIRSVPHIVAEIEAIFGDNDITLDGELYNHDLKSDFEKIVSLVRQDEPGEGHEIVQYHIYDQVHMTVNFAGRYENLSVMFDLHEPLALHLVDTVAVETEDKVMAAFKLFTADGYEGAMIRNDASMYVNKRSSDLLKVKEFQDDEFQIIGIDEGRGKLAGHVGSFVCRTPSGQEFLAKMSGDTGKLKEYFENHDLWKGKLLTVQYQGLTGSAKVPRFPVGLRLREIE